MFSLIRKILFSAGFTLFFLHVISAQENKAEISKKNIAFNEFLSLVITFNTRENERPVYSPFPEIQNFIKVGTPTVTTTTLGGQSVVIQTITQRYKARKEGNFNLPKLSVKINNQTLATEPIIVSVLPAKKSETPSEIELYEELIAAETQEFLDVKEDAFLALTTDKKEVFTGEGFTVTLALYVAESNKADLDSYKQSEQLTKIIKQLKPENCWEEDFGIQEYQAISILIKGKRYNAYTFYRATFFPFNTQPVPFPSIGLIMIKYKLSPSPNELKKTEFTTFRTQAQTISVKPLPPHPLREKISVGNFILFEEISDVELKAGKSFRFNFRVSGNGNISALNLPVPTSDTILDIYPPHFQQVTNYFGNQVSGSKTAFFQLIPKKTGEYRLGDYFQWIFFNLQKQEYDTLKATIRINVSGENLQNTNFSFENLEPIYQNIRKPSQENISVFEKIPVRLYATIFLATLFMFVLLYTLRRK